MDVISDMLIRIKNASRAGHASVSVPFSKFKFEIAKVLKKAEFIEDFSKKGKGIKRYLELILKYDAGKNPKINDLRRISKQGQRVYKNFKELHPIKQGYGKSIISTSKGLMTNKEAKRAKLGGEIIFEIY